MEGIGRARARPAVVIAAVAKCRSQPGTEWLSIGSHEFEKLEEIRAAGPGFGHAIDKNFACHAAEPVQKER
jgi:hypothetical protein